jgi:hypothetical protein
MEWIYIAVIAGSIATSGYPNEEACQGHKVVFDRDHKTNGVCVKMPQYATGTATIYGGTLSNCMRMDGTIC